MLRVVTAMYQRTQTILPRSGTACTFDGVFAGPSVASRLEARQPFEGKLNSFEFFPCSERTRRHVAGPNLRVAAARARVFAEVRSPLSNAPRPSGIPAIR